MGIRVGLEIAVFDALPQLFHFALPVLHDFISALHFFFVIVQRVMQTNRNRLLAFPRLQQRQQMFIAMMSSGPAKVVASQDARRAFLDFIEHQVQRTSG